MIILRNHIYSPISFSYPVVLNKWKGINRLSYENLTIFLLYKSLYISMGEGQYGDGEYRG